MSSPDSPVPPLTPDLAAAIERGYAARDREHMQPTIDYFRGLLEQDPEHPVLLYEVGGAYDTASEEERAADFYQQALDRGLGGDPLRRCLIQYGSTLRNLERFDESVAMLDRARTQFPQSDAVRAFLALSLHAAGRSDAAVAELLLLVADRVDTADISRYHAALRGNADWLRDDSENQTAAETTVQAAFDMVDRHEVPYDEPEQGPRLTRVTIHKRYHGAIDGAGVAEVLTAQGDSGSGYLASERVVGTLDGRRGSFVIQHGGLADNGELSTTGRIIPHSGTDDLAGIHGRATEDAEGVLTLVYTL